ncbi:MAG TPA: VOC family protein, partial [Hyphomicrobiaceae bacterium]|nr:VOC family protein [Hyphomicrobiaceae bacterium]
MRYRNPGAAARWLCDAFGFREHESAQESDHHVKYILLRLGDSGILVRPVSSSVFDDLMVEPSAVGGGNTHVLYLPIPDAELHCERAKAAGAKVELEPQEDGLGGRFYTCRDPEGHLWSFGTKDYGLGTAPAAAAPLRGALAPARPVHSTRPGKRSLFARGFAVVAMLGALAAGWLLYEAYTQGAFEAGTTMTTAALERGQAASDQTAPGSRIPPQEVAQLTEERDRRQAAEAAFAEATAKVAEEQARRLAAETRAGDAETKLSQISAAAAEARQAAQRLETETARERGAAKDALTAAEQRLAEHLAEAVREKEAASKALRDAQALLREEKAAGVRAQAALEALAAEAANERARQAAAAIAASAEAAASRQQLAELELERGKQTSELEGAYSTLKAMRGELEALRASQAAAKQEAASVPAVPAVAVEPQASPAPPLEAKRVAAAEPAAPVAAVEPQGAAAPLANAALPPARPTTPCAQAVQGKVRLGPNGSRLWPEGSLARLCHGAETSVEPARCFD